MALYVPIRGTADGVCLPLDALPEDAISVVDVLRAEAAPLALWLQLAVEYYKVGKEHQFRTLLEEGTRDEIEQHYRACKSERIGILSALGVFHTRSAMKQDEKSKREQIFELAATYFKKADSIDIHESQQWLGKGLMYLATGDFVRAELQFNSILDRHPVNRNPGSIAALLGKGCVSYCKKDYKSGLAAYSLALKSNPGCPAYVRLGIALCALHLGDYHLAKLAFQRVLVLDAYNVEALVGLAILHLGSKDEPIRTSIAMLEKAYSINPACPLALTMLADHLFYHGDHQAVFDLCSTSNKNTTSGLLRSRNLYMIARSYHIQNQFSQARFNYVASAEYNETNVLALLGLGQIHMRENDFNSARRCFEIVLKQHPDEFDCLRLLGITYSRIADLEQAQRLLSRARELVPNNVDVLVELGHVFLNGKVSDKPKAKSVFIEAVRALESSKGNRDIPYQLFNNIGVIALYLGQLSEAEAWLTRCADSISDESVPAVLYNQALLYEAKGELNRASQLYNKILEIVPDYYECHLRLSNISVHKGDLEEAVRRIGSSLERDPSNIHLLTQLGRLYTSGGKTHDAEKCFSKVLSVRKHDAYCRISLGNLYLSRSIHARKVPDQMEQYLRKAEKYYKSVLERDVHNVYAANGLGACLAYRKMHDRARLVFSDVREAATFIPTAWINLAHLAVMDSSFDAAIKLYETCLKKRSAGESDSELLLFLARAHFLKGDMQTAKQSLQTAIRFKSSSMLWYNLALASEDYSFSVLQKPKASRTIHEVRQAVLDINNAYNIFKALELHAEGLVKEKATAHAAFCNSSLDLAQRHLAYAEKSESQAADARRQLELSIETAFSAEQSRVQEELKRQEEKERKIQEALLQDRLKLQRIQEQQYLKAKRKEQSDNDDSDDGGTRRVKRKKQQASHDTRMDVDQRGDGRKKMDDEVDVNEEDNTRRTLRKKSSRIIADDDENGEEI